MSVAQLKNAPKVSPKGRPRMQESDRNDNWTQLLSQVAQNRDEAAFAQLFDHFAPLIKGFTISNMSYSLPGEAADELVQEVMLKIWTKSKSFDAKKASASTWIFTIMRNCRIDMMRKNGRHNINQDDVEVDDIWDDDLDNQPFVSLQHARNETVIDKSLKQLPVEQKQVLAQVYMQGKSHSEIADETGLPLGTVKSRVRMGLKKLQISIPSK